MFEAQKDLPRHKGEVRIFNPVLPFAVFLTYRNLFLGFAQHQVLCSYFHITGEVQLKEFHTVLDCSFTSAQLSFISSFMCRVRKLPIPLTMQ